MVLLSLRRIKKVVVVEFVGPYNLLTVVCFTSNRKCMKILIRQFDKKMTVVLFNLFFIMIPRKMNPADYTLK
jgi:hypothetical protein